jgi:hypothetical protein
VIAGFYHYFSSKIHPCFNLLSAELWIKKATKMTIDNLKYPIGTYAKPIEITQDLLNEYILAISTFPEKLKKEVQDLTDAQLDTPYRPGGWTIRQVVHHCADSHLNSLTRFKLALTEDNPTIRPYFEDRWAELADSKTMPIEASLKMIEGIHARWTVLLTSLSALELARTFFHPESNKQYRLDETMGTYAWHCNHHLAHITNLKDTKK